MENYFSFGTVSSTNDIAKILLDQINEVIITANYQTKGRGRNNKHWVGDYGKNIYLSYGIKHRNLETSLSHTMLMYQSIGCLAVKKVLEYIAPNLQFVLKYPNDIYALQNNRWKKISGVLIENEFVGSNLKSTIIGIGINGSQQIFDAELAATSLVLLGIKADILDIKHRLIREIKIYVNAEAEYIIKEWKKELRINKKMIQIVGEEGIWKVQDINEFGLLILSNEGKERVINNGDSIRYELE
ncbi:MAG: biotin--[acetyl-CoA-carboxylase] ligase [Ignavibacteria bacterium]|nr:biotin--[acetyl-CoA-carboxylase] ligase [Ignavibacteria bacterium]